LHQIQIKEQRLEQYEANRRADEQTLIVPDVVSGI
jgi:hypothetical protein